MPATAPRGRRPRPAARRGASIVEFAVIAPLLFALLLGIVEFGRLFMVAQVAVNGSREGARFAVQGEKERTAKDAREYTTQYLAATGVPGDAVATCALSYQAGNGSWVALADADPMTKVPSGTPVKVDVRVNFDKVTWLPSGIFLSQGTLVPGTTVMRRE